MPNIVNVQKVFSSFFLRNQTLWSVAKSQWEAIDRELVWGAFSNFHIQALFSSFQRCVFIHGLLVNVEGGGHAGCHFLNRFAYLRFIELTEGSCKKSVETGSHVHNIIPVLTPPHHFTYQDFLLQVKQNQYCLFLTN